jgi:hypothetical protein
MPFRSEELRVIVLLNRAIYGAPQKLPTTRNLGI